MRVILRILSRGDGEQPLPADQQPVLFERIVEARESTAAEWFRAIGAEPDERFANEPALVLTDQNAGADTAAPAFWNRDATGPCWLLGIELPDDLQNGPVPKHGIRVDWQEAA